MEFQSIVLRVDVSDIDASVEWYTEKLGMRISSKYQTEEWVELTRADLGNVTLGLFWDEEAMGTDFEVINFVVANLQAARQELIDKGVEVDDIEESDNGIQLAFFEDPDGNLFALRQNPS